MSFFLWLYIFFVYLKTLAPTVVLHDSGELITSAHILGITHPPGYPLYCILGKLITLIPIGNIAFRMNLFSAVSASLASLVLYFIILRLFGDKDKETSIFLGIISCLCFAYARTVWLQSVICEKYTLNALFLSLLLYILILWNKSARFSYLYLFFFVLGLGFSHHLQTLFIIPAFLFLLITGIFKDKIKFHPPQILFSILVFLIPLILYIYLPIRASTYPSLCWNLPNTLQRFIYHITASEYRQYFSWENILSTLSLHLSFFIKEFNIFTLLIPLGLFYSFFKHKRLFYIFLLITSVDFLHCLRYKIHNISDYYIPTYFISSIWIASGIHFIASFFQRYKRFIIMFCFLSLTLICYIKNLYFTNYRNHYFAYDYAKNILRWQDRNSLCFVKGDTLMFPLWYIHYVENYRDDILLIDILSLRNSWYITWLDKYYGFVLKDKEDNLYKRFDEILTIYKDRSVYLAYDETISPKYKLIPAGILHKINRQINTKEILDEFDPVYRYIHNNVYIDERTSHNIKNYSIAHNNRGKYYQDMNLYKKAEKEYNSSLLIDKNNSFTYYQLGMLHRRQDHKKALFYFNKATVVAPEKAYGYYGCALIYYDQGLYRKAERLYKKAIEIDKDAYFLYEELAILYMQERRYKEAEEYFKLALEKNPASKVAKEQLLLLQQKVK